MEPLVILAIGLINILSQIQNHGIEAGKYPHLKDIRLRRNLNFEPNDINNKEHFRNVANLVRNEDIMIDRNEESQETITIKNLELLSKRNREIDFEKYPPAEIARKLTKRKRDFNNKAYVNKNNNGNNVNKDYVKENTDEKYITDKYLANNKAEHTKNNDNAKRNENGNVLLNKYVNNYASKAAKGTDTSEETANKQTRRKRDFKWFGWWRKRTTTESPQIDTSNINTQAVNTNNGYDNNKSKGYNDNNYNGYNSVYKGNKNNRIANLQHNTNSANITANNGNNRYYNSYNNRYNNNGNLHQNTNSMIFKATTPRYNLNGAVILGNIWWCPKFFVNKTFGGKSFCVKPDEDEDDDE